MMNYYLNITLLVDEPIQFTVFSDYGRRLKTYKLFSGDCEPFEVVNGESILIEYADAVVLDAYGPRSTLEFDECDVPGFVQNYIKHVRIERVNY